MKKPLPSSASFPKRVLPALLAFAILLAGFVALYVAAQPAAKDDSLPAAENYSEYDNARVLEILSDSCEPDELSEGHYRGTQVFTAEVLTGQYTGKTLRVENAVGPLYGNPAKPGDKLTLIISTYDTGEIRATVFQNDLSTIIFVLIAIFMLATVLVGGKIGLKSLLGLVLTIVVLIWVLLPLLLRGWETIPTTLLICGMLACACFLLLGGINRKTICAMLGTLSGLILATCFGMAAQALLGIDGYRLEYAEALLQLRQTGESTVGIGGLMVAGVEISALGAVMDVAMSISSAMNELATVGHEMSVKKLLSSGMHIGRDMVGTMTNTLILAIFGSSTTMILYIYSLNLPIYQFLSSDYLSTELISGISSSIGVILSVPLSAAIGAIFYGKSIKKSA